MLIAALLELKSRLMLPRADDDVLDLEPGEAAEELLARMLEARRYRRAADHLAARLAGEDGVRYRCAPLPRSLRRTSLADAGAVYDPRRLGAALGGLLRVAAAGRPRARHRARRSPSPSASGTCARCCCAAPARSTRRSAAPTA